MYVVCIRRYRFMFKHLIPGTPRNGGRSAKKKRDVDDFYKANVRQLICGKCSRGSRIHFIQ
jgi:hypothetical protein